MARPGFAGRALPPVLLSTKGKAHTMPHHRERAPAPVRRATFAAEEPAPAPPGPPPLKAPCPARVAGDAKGSHRLRAELEELRQTQGWARAPPPPAGAPPAPKRPAPAPPRPAPAKHSATPSASDSEGEGTLEVLDVQAWTRSTPLKGTLAEEERLQREIDELTELHERDQKEIQQLNAQITGMMDRLLFLRAELARAQSNAPPHDPLQAD